MPDPSLLRRAASCYTRGGWLHEAARCYRAAGSHQDAARTWESAGALAEAAADFVAAGLAERAGWLLVHHLGDPSAARAAVAAPAPERPEAGRPTASAPLLRRLVLARCDVADGGADGRPRETLDEVMDRLADRGLGWLDPDIETWAVLTAEAMRRPDLVALIFAAAVRGHRPGAGARWDEWSSTALLVPLVLPPDTGADWSAAEPVPPGT
jgi:hypothetical protein